MTQENNVKGFEDSGGNVLIAGAITDGQYLKRSGNNIVSSPLLSITLRENSHESDYDFTVNNFTTDGTWRDLDLSSILPAGTTKFWCRVMVMDNLDTPIFGLRKNGNTGMSDAQWIRVGAVTNLTNYGSLGPIGVDANRVCEYYATFTTWTTINLVITAYQ